MRWLLRFEHWLIRTFKFDRMSNNLLWLLIALFPLVAGLFWWLLRLHDEPDTEFVFIRDPAFSGNVAAISYQDGSFFLQPQKERLLINWKPVTRRTKLQENDQIVVGHTIFQARQLDDWTPHLQTIGYYAPDRDLHDGVSVGRSIHPEEQNGWQMNEIIVQDSSVEPVHFAIFPAQNKQYQVKSVGQKGIYVPIPPPKEEKSSRTKTAAETTMQWGYLPTEGTALLQSGHRIAAGNTVFELVDLPEQEALALKIMQGVRPEYALSRSARNILGGLRMIPKDYIPDYLVDEEFIEYVRQAIEYGLFTLDDTGTTLRVRGFDLAGKLATDEFSILSTKEKFLLHKIFNFREQAGARLRWRRPFNRDADDGYAFYPKNIENFIIDPATRQVKNVYRYSAYLTNPHTIAEEIATERGEIYDRDRHSHAKLLVYANPQEAPIAEMLLVPNSQPDTILSINTQKPLDNQAYVAGGYKFSEGTMVLYEADTFLKSLKGAEKAPLQPGETFTDGQYTFRYVAPGNGLLAQNTKNGRYYPLGQKLVHLIGYSYAKSQFKGNLEKVFDQVLLGAEKKQPWWSLKRTIARTPGNNVMLTVDDDLQRVVFAELQKKLDDLNARYKTDQFKGAAIAINADGEILASASIPSYNPNDIHNILRALKESSEDHWNSSYINRATHKGYPPGSTMKVIMSTIALDNKAQFLLDVGNGQYMINDQNRAFACTGWLSSFRGVSFGKYGVPDFDGDSHGPLSLDQALTKSCNNTFAFLALNAGHKTIQSYAERYGFNSRFDFLPYQMFKDDVQLVSNIRRELRDPLASLASQVPDPKEELKITQLARMGIGQWEILATPLQMATVAMTVGNSGQRPYPHLIKAIEDRATQTTRTLPYPQRTEVFPASIMAELFPMMQHVVQIGSAIRITRSTIPYYTLKDHVAGKTGTAEVEDQTGKKYNVVWFTCFAPVERPQKAVAVVIEKGPIISGEAVEVARGIWEKAVLLYPEIFLTAPPVQP